MVGPPRLPGSRYVFIDVARLFSALDVSFSSHRCVSIHARGGKWMPILGFFPPKMWFFSHGKKLEKDFGVAALRRT